MAYVLSLSPSSPLTASLGNEAPGRSCSSVASIGSGGTVQHNRLRSISTSSLSSVGSYFVPSFRRHAERSDTPPRSTSSINLNINKIRNQFDRRSASATNSTRTSIASAISARVRSDSLAPSEPRELRLVNVAESEDEIPRKSNEQASQGSNFDHEDTQSSDLDDTLQCAVLLPDIDEAGPSVMQPPPFKRWVSKLRKKRQQHLPPPAVSARKERWALDDFDSKPTSPQKPRHSHHRRSDSATSSLKFVTAMRSATATLASTSIANISRRTGKWRRGQQRSSMLSEKDIRPSIDSVRSVIDEAAKQRSRKRREKVEELIRTEESYVADVKALSNAYSTILKCQGPAQKTITDILHLHDDLLGRLYSVIPFAEYDQTTAKLPSLSSGRYHHTRWHSVDVVPQRLTPTRAVLAAIRPGRRSLDIRRSSGEDQDPAMMRCSPDIVAAITQVFGDYIGRFAVYEEFGANYDLIQRDIDDAQRSIASWSDYDKAIEAISVHINPTRTHEENRRKAMTVKDLLIKPIQRIPRYELLFGELCKFTPVCDDPNAHSGVDDLQIQLNEACCRMNEAKENPGRARALQTTWLIGDRLNFSSQVPRSVFLQLLGQVRLCGCLHIAYRGRDGIKGCYVICVLFESSLLLASSEDDQPKYSTLAGIALANATIEETDNQKGLQCHTAPHSWKVVFEHSARMYELIFSACSAIEADVWRSHLANSIEAQAQAVAEGKANVFELQSPLTTEMKSIGKAFGKPGSFVRRMSVHRTATVGPTSDLNQVIIKNTQGVKEVHDNASQTSLQIPRSQSVQTPSHVQTLAPRRTDRHRLESMMADIWTRELLPYPGMVRRSDPIRASANHVIRKFSMASITSNFSTSKRTPSYTSIASSRKEDMPPPSSRGSRRNSRAGYPARPPLVNFHNAPDAFLPADFELQEAGPKRKRSALRTFTMTMERPFSPLLGGENKPSGLRRAQSVRDIGEGGGRPTPSPVPPLEAGNGKVPAPVYSVNHERAKTPASLQAASGAAARETAGVKTPRKSKSRMLMRLFG